ncbi:PLP-dependent cysteine synthase family protein, partial [Curtobacterium sp. B18]|uniref:PLP-dependent cysteine synthase family protein n=1 Tax=Curtobacterium sp. B18 TaxID=95614 RepID=UPI0004CF3089
MRYANSVVDLVGDTPLVKLNRVTEGVRATVLVKVEYLNPGGSSKDRIATRILDAAEASGELQPGGTIVEPTSGNTGVGLALVAQQRGYRCVFVLPDKVGEDKRNVLTAYGAEIVVTPTAVPVDMVVTCTGNLGVVGVDEMLALKHLAIVANVGHFDNEIDM